MADNLFANYEQDFRDVFSSIENHLRTIPNLTSPDQKLNEIKKTAQDITDAEDILQSMNLNARNVAGPQGQRLTLKIREYEGKVQTAKKDLRRMETTVTSVQDREELMGGAILSSELNASLDQRERLLTGTDRLHKSNQTLLDARRTAESTVETGANILSNLESQRETMQRSMGRLDDINAKLSQSSRILTAMARRVATNKLIMAVIILVLLGAIVLIAWLKFRK